MRCLKSLTSYVYSFYPLISGKWTHVDYRVECLLMGLHCLKQIEMVYCAKQQFLGDQTIINALKIRF